MTEVEAVQTTAASQAEAAAPDAANSTADGPDAASKSGSASDHGKSAIAILKSMGAHVQEIKDARLRLQGVDLGKQHLIDGQHISFEVLLHLKRLSNVFLGIADTPFDDEGMQGLARLDNLQGLNLNRTRISDEGLSYLKDHRALKVLTLERTKITDEGLRHLVSLNDLRMLSLDRTAITDAGLQHLKQLKQLRLLILRHTKVSRSGAEEIRSALPDCDVEL